MVGARQDDNDGSEGDKQLSVLFCCLGNICRSPLAEAVFAYEVEKQGLKAHFAKIDSCGTGAYHQGDDPDERTVAVCRQNGVPITGSARKVKLSDFSNFDYIFGMDASNVRNLLAMQPKNSRATVHLFGDFDDKKPIVDPYYGGDHGFQIAFKQCDRYVSLTKQIFEMKGEKS